MPPLPCRQFWILLHELAERPAVRRKLATSIIVLGALLRLRQFFEVRSFWGDEAMLALNLSVYDFGDLLSKPLAFDQIAPIGFLLLCKAASVVLGVNELAFRLTPLMFGLAGPFLGMSQTLLKLEVASYPLVTYLVGLSESVNGGALVGGRGLAAGRSDCRSRRDAA